MAPQITKNSHFANYLKIYDFINMIIIIDYLTSGLCMRSLEHKIHLSEKIKNVFTQTHCLMATNLFDYTAVLPVLEKEFNIHKKVTTNKPAKKRVFIQTE